MISKWQFIVTLLLIACTLFSSNVANKETSDLCGLTNSSYVDGEMLKYKLYYNWSFVWIPAGEVTFHLTTTDSTYEANIEGRSYGSYDNFFRVRDQFHSSIDKETLHPLRFCRKVEEGKYRRFDSLMFDYELGSIYSLNGETKESAKSDTFALANCVQDLVSIMYNLRNVNTDAYQPGDQISGNIFFDKEQVPLTIDYLKKENKKVKGMGRFQTVKIQPKVIIGNVFKEDDIMHIWVSDDGNKIPLVIQSPIRIGSVKAILLEHKGLAHELSLVD